MLVINNKVNYWQLKSGSIPSTLMTCYCYLQNVGMCKACRIEQKVQSKLTFLIRGSGGGEGWGYLFLQSKLVSRKHPSKKIKK